MGYYEHTPKKGLFKIANEKGEMLEGKIAANYMNQYYTPVGENLSKNFKENSIEYLNSRIIYDQ